MNSPRMIFASFIITRSNRRPPCKHDWSQPLLPEKGWGKRFLPRDSDLVTLRDIETEGLATVDEIASTTLIVAIPLIPSFLLLRI